MSIEEAIKDHAGALRELAAAMRERNAPLTALAGQAEAAVKKIKDSLLDDKVAELSEARGQRVAATKEAVAQDAKWGSKEDPESVHNGGRHLEPEEAAKLHAMNARSAGVKSDAELDAAVEKVEQAALEYKKDVFPVLLQVNKVRGKEALRELLTKYGAKTGDALKADQFAGIVADANALMAG